MCCTAASVRHRCTGEHGPTGTTPRAGGDGGRSLLPALLQPPAGDEDAERGEKQSKACRFRESAVLAVGGEKQAGLDWDWDTGRPARPPRAGGDDGSLLATTHTATTTSPQRPCIEAVLSYLLFCISCEAAMIMDGTARSIKLSIYPSIVWNGVLIYLHSDYSMHECLCDRLLVLCSVARCVGSFGSIIASKSFVNCCICVLSDAAVIVLRSTCDETACSENYKENSWCRIVDQP